MHRFTHFQQLTHDALQLQTRRHFLGRCAAGLGALWLAQQGQAATGVQQHVPHPRASAKRVIYLHMAGGPSHLEMFEYKPELKRLDGKDCPEEFLKGRRFAFIRGVPKMLGPVHPFRQVGESGAWLSNQLVHFESVVDHAAIVHTVSTDQFNHAPAQLLLHTGNQNLGAPSIGSWVTYGLGSENENMPGYVVLISGGKFPSAGKSVWGSGFLPSVYQGVQCRSEGEPVLYLANPRGINARLRGHIVDAINRVNRRTFEELGDPETVTRISQYELAHRMQLAASEAMDTSREPRHIHELYGTQPGKESFANNCLLARRLVERGVRYVQLFDWGWDTHGNSEETSLLHGFQDKCRDIDQPMAALLSDLRQRGLLDDTLVIWGGEFGRTPMRENRGGKEMKFAGRDHHPFAFTMWMAGGGVKPGVSYGETDPLGYAPARDAVEPRDLHATYLRLLGIDHTKLTYRFQGLDQRLTTVLKPARVLAELVS